MLAWVVRAWPSLISNDRAGKQPRRSG